MAKYIGPKCKLARREKMDLELKSSKKPLDKKCNMQTTPGEHGSARTRLSNHGVQFREKQKVKRIYGLMDRKFHSYYKKASLSKSNSGEKLLQILESRLDNVVYRMGFASTRAEARQIVSHKLIMVNDKVCNIPSLILRPFDKISIREKAKNHQRILEAVNLCKSLKGCSWLTVDAETLTGVFNEAPERSLLSKDINEQLIIELYSK